MTYVVMWLNDDPIKINHCEGNKPSLVDDLILSMLSNIRASVSAGTSGTVGAKLVNYLRNKLVYIEKHIARAKALDL